VALVSLLASPSGGGDVTSESGSSPSSAVGTSTAFWKAVGATPSPQAAAATGTRGSAAWALPAGLLHPAIAAALGGPKTLGEAVRI
jgi:hypothetical protein